MPTLSENMHKLIKFDFIILEKVCNQSIVVVDHNKANRIGGRVRITVGKITKFICIVYRILFIDQLSI
jgi:hypothetical protein